MNIFGKYFDDNEKVLKSLTKIYGVGRSTAYELGVTFGIGYNNKVKDVSKETWSRIIQAIELGPKKYSSAVKLVKPNTGSSLRELTVTPVEITPKEGKGVDAGFVINKKLNQVLCENRALTAIRDNIDLAKKIKSYTGLRHLEGLPCRGQRTHTNAITARKKRLSRG